MSIKAVVIKSKSFKCNAIKQLLYIVEEENRKKAYERIN